MVRKPKNNPKKSIRHKYPLNKKGTKRDTTRTRVIIGSVATLLAGMAILHLGGKGFASADVEPSTVVRADDDVKEDLLFDDNLLTDLEEPRLLSDAEVQAELDKDRTDKDIEDELFPDPKLRRD